MVKTTIPARQVDPLKLPSETTLTFWILFVAVVVGAAICNQHSIELIRIWAHGKIAGNTWTWFAGPAFVFGCMVLIYFLEPVLILHWKNRSVLLLAEDAARQRIEKLFESLNLKIPVVWCSKVGTSQDAQAFGSLDANMLIQRGLHCLIEKSPATFDAVILHELGHIAHRDIWKIYLAKTAVRGFLILLAINILLVSYQFASALLPMCSDSMIPWNSCWETSLYSYIAILLNYIPPTLVVLFSYRLLLRYREYYADQIAASHGGLEKMLRIFNTTRPASPKPIFCRLLSFHPSAERRAEALLSPTTIFLSSKWLLLAISVRSAALLSISTLPSLTYKASAAH